MLVNVLGIFVAFGCFFNPSIAVGVRPDKKAQVKKKAHAQTLSGGARRLKSQRQNDTNDTVSLKEKAVPAASGNGTSPKAKAVPAASGNGTSTKAKTVPAASGNGTSPKAKTVPAASGNGTSPTEKAVPAASGNGTSPTEKAMPATSGNGTLPTEKAVPAASGNGTLPTEKAVPAASGNGTLPGEAPAASGQKLNAVPANVEPELKKVAVEIFYETKCPSCQAFISTTLRQVWDDEEFRKRIKVLFYPYGNGQTLLTQDIALGYRFWHEEMDAEGIDYMFPCQHGPDECFGNMLQACAIDTLSEQAAIVPFIICMETNMNKSLELAAWDCGNEQGVDLDKVKSCMHSSHGNKLMFKMANRTDSLVAPAGPKAYVPWITIDGIHTGPDDGSTGGDGPGFVELLCAAMSEPRPTACNATLLDANATEADASESNLSEANLSMVVTRSGAHCGAGVPAALLFVLACAAHFW